MMSAEKHRKGREEYAPRFAPCRSSSSRSKNTSLSMGIGCWSSSGGRDASGKDGTIKRIIAHMSPRETRVAHSKAAEPKLPLRVGF
jgi:hypothetical protein